ncbi:4-hydroxybenzoate transporter [Pandoraea iniqua]|uniref:MFS transporter n=1 Tax=Pandoraea iniqua TaxID=2508288 RepID=UPI001240B75F|nr:MFS transporter [Pandoraea iniqua]VVD89065.1 4-hydroxybenzoate transporter [Pandoraea iniqua]
MPNINTSATGPAPLDLQSFLDGRRMSGLQWRVVVLCFLIVAIDGIDIGLAAYIAPAVRREWGLSVAELSPIFVSALIGMMAGSLLFGPLADRRGRRFVLLASVATFGLATLATLFATNVTELSVLRFIAGAGIGGASPAAVTLTAEYASGKRKLSIITLMMCGNSMGSAFGGVVASQIIERHGWHAMVLVGGVLPILLLPVLWALLPESMRFLALRRPHEQERLRALGRRIAPDVVTPQTTFVALEKKQSRSPVRELLVAPYARGTLLLWAAFFMGLSVLYLMASWLPTIITNSGGSMRNAALITALWSIGGTTGGLLLGRVMDSARPAWVLGAAYAVAFVTVICIGRTFGNAAVLAPLVYIAGVCISGTQVGLNGLAATYYPTANRATGVAWATGIGRFGSILGSSVGGLLLGSGMAYPVLFAIVGVPALVAAFCMFAMPATRREPAPALAPISR